MKLLLALGVAFSLALTVLVAVGASAHADIVPPSDDVLTEGQVQEMRYWMENGGLENMRLEQKIRWERIMGRAMRKAYLPELGEAGASLAPTLVTGGLATVAAGVWVHNAIVIRNAVDCGQATCPPAIVLDGQFRRAADADSAVYVEKDNSGNVLGVAMLDSFSWSYDASSASAMAKFRWSIKGFPRCSNCLGVKVFDAGVTSTAARSGYVPYLNTSSANDGTKVTASPYTMQITMLKAGQTVTGSIVSSVSGQISNWMTGRPATESFSWKNPVFDEQLGPDTHTVAPAEYTPAPGDYVPSNEQNKKLYDAIKADPEFDPNTDEPTTWEQDHEKRVGILAPDHGGEQWTRDNPDGSRTTKFGDGTELTTWPDKTELLRSPTGVETWKNPDGTQVQYDPNTGKRITTYPDGTTHEEQFNDKPSTNPGPSTVPDSDVWKDPTGNTEPAPDQTKYPSPDTNSHSDPTGDTDGPTNQSGDSCVKGPKWDWKWPHADIAEVFPFSILIQMSGLFSSLVSGPQSPVFVFDLSGNRMVLDLSRWDGVAALIRTVISIAFFLGLSWEGYKIITQGDE